MKALYVQLLFNVWFQLLKGLLQVKLYIKNVSLGGNNNDDGYKMSLKQIRNNVGSQRLSKHYQFTHVISI